MNFAPKSIPRLILLTLTLALSGTAAHARWAQDEDAASEVEFQNVDTEVREDGTYETVVETQVKLLKESARTELGTQLFSYNSNTTEFKVLAARTQVDGKQIAVDSSKIEDKPRASSQQGFDQMNQVMIAFPEVKIGASVYTKVRLRVKEASFPGFFSAEYSYGVPVREKAGRVRIRSAIPLAVDRNDPSQVLAIEEVKKGATQEITITLKEPVYRVAVDEQAAALNPSKFPWVSVSTARDITEIMKPVTASYQKILEQPLPPRFEAIRAKAATQARLVDKLNTITSELASQVSYLGDWRTNAGKYIPRDLAAIAETQYGDCKDYSASTASILRKLGYRAEIALVHRSNVYNRPGRARVLPSDFNHAIVWFRDGERDYWIDPTNFVSFAQGMFRDIAGRPALVTRGEAPLLTETPRTRPEDARVNVTKILSFGEPNSPEGRDRRFVEGQLRLEGVSATGYTGAALTHSRRSLDLDLTRYFVDPNLLIDWKTADYDLTSRVVRDLDFKVFATIRDTPIRTSAGHAYYLGAMDSVTGILLTKTADRVSDLQTGSPFTYRITTELRDVKLVGRKSLDCEIESPWLSAKRRLKLIPRGVRIEEQAIVRGETIPEAELRSLAFAQMQEKLRNCLGQAALIYERIGGGGRALASEVSGSKDSADGDGIRPRP